MSPCRSFGINQSFVENYCFPFLRITYHSTNCVFVMTVLHTRYMLQSNRTIYYTKLCSRQHILTLMSRHQGIQRINPRHIIGWPDGDSLESKHVAVSIIFCNKLLCLTETYIVHELDKHIGMTTVKNKMTVAIWRMLI